MLYIYACFEVLTACLISNVFFTTENVKIFNETLI